MMEFTDFATLQERMQGRKIINQEFREINQSGAGQAS